jgi:uncharacterized protein (DUF302 family)
MHSNVEMEGRWQVGRPAPDISGLAVTVNGPMDEAEVAVRKALSENGFGVLTEIDVAATLRSKLGVQRSDLKILGACNPSLAHRALEIDSDVALMLPCNVVLEDLGDGRTKVAIADPRTLLGALGKSNSVQLSELESEAAEALGKVLDSVKS